MTANQSLSTSDSADDQVHRSPRFGTPRRGLILWFGVVAFSLVVGGYAYFLRESSQIRREKYDDLRAIADLKIGQIVRWRRERIGDARVHASRSLFRTAVVRRLQASDAVAMGGELRENMESLRDSYGYSDVILARTDGTVLLSLDAHLTGLDSVAKGLVARTVASENVEFGDFFRCRVCGKVHLDVAAPINSAESRPVAVLILRSDPEDLLYPLIQSWPLPSESAETLIVRKDGDDVLFLNPLRHVPAPPLTLRISLSKTDVPGVLAASGEIGECEGPDYRGVKVLAHIRGVPDSPWFMVAKVDASEVLAEVEYHGYVVVLFVVLSTVIAGGAAALVFHSGRRALYENLYHAERRRREAQDEIRTTLYSIGDAVIATDAAGRVTRMNPVAARLTGWPEAEALGEPLERVFHVVNEETRSAAENPVARVIREGVVVGLANHTALLARDGAEYPIADSGAPIRNEGGRILGVVLVFRDQTEQRRAERALEESEKSLRRERDFAESLVETAQAVVLVLDTEGRIVRFNPYMEEISGYRLQEVQGRDWFSTFLPPETREDTQERFAKAIADIPTRGRVNSIVLRDGSRRKIEWYDKTLKDAGGDVVGLVAIGQDVTERERAEEELRWKTAFLEAQVNASLDGILVVDEHGMRILTNQRLVQLWSIPQHVLDDLNDEVLFRYVTGLVTDPEQSRARVAHLYSHRNETGRDEMVFRNGSTFDVYTAPVLGRDGRYYGRIWTFRDMTERKRTEEQVRRQMEELQRWHNLTLGREDRVLDLKREVNRLLARLGEPPRYEHGDG